MVEAPPMWVQGKSFPDHHELLEICQFHPFANLVGPHITVCWWHLVPDLIINSTPFHTQTGFNMEDKLYGRHYKNPLRSLALLIGNKFPKRPFLIFTTLLFTPLSSFSFLATCSFTDSCCFFLRLNFLESSSFYAWSLWRSAFSHDDRQGVF